MTDPSSLGAHERFWHVRFGDDYVERNRNERLLAEYDSPIPTAVLYLGEMDRLERRS